jgi:deoxyribose-phosphate aldolase
MASPALVDLITERVMARLSGANLTVPGGSNCSCAVQPAHEIHLRAMLEHGACRLACGERAKTLPPELAATIDHTLLKPEATEEQVRQLCAEARQFGFAAVCINPTWVRLCSTLLAGSRVITCTVIGFPLGANCTQTKAFEARLAVEQGAGEVDMVLNIGALKSRQYGQVFDDIAAVVHAAAGRACTKVILETSLLTEEEKVAACALAKEACADYVKTSTGFAGGGATVEDVALMRRVVGTEVGVKASGGVKDRATAEAMLRAGANRIGASAGVKIVTSTAAAAGGAY